MSGFASKAAIAKGHQHISDTTIAPSIIISPGKPLIEKDIYGYYLNFDIIIKNQTEHTIQLSSVEVAVMDNSGKPVLRKSINCEGRSPGMDLSVVSEIKPGQTISVFNPFYTFQPNVEVGSLKYGLFFDYADTQEQREYNKSRLPIDYDASVVKIIAPEVYIAKNVYYLPLKGKMIVWDGHDFYSRNRRSTGDETDKMLRNNFSNESRYAYDLMSVDVNGEVYSGTPFKKQNWFVYGKPVVAPADGKVIAVRNDVPDNEYKGKTIEQPKLPGNTDPLGKGNYIVIQHGNGERSEFLNLGQGSVKVRPGDEVKAGQEMANVGFSGNARYPHLHYAVTKATKEQAPEGLPNYFNSYKLYRGESIVRIGRSRIDSGDIVESTK